MKRTLLIGAALLCCWAAQARAAEPPIKIGEINSYKAIPLYTENYRKGWVLAVEEINAAGGIKGRKIEVIDRDDQGQPGQAVRVAQELVLNEKIDFLSGCMFGNICLALGEFAQKNKIPLMRWFANSEHETERESAYVFGLNSLYVTARAPVAFLLAQHPELKRWGSIAPNYAYGHQATEIFFGYLKTRKPETDWLTPYWFPVGKLDASATIGAIQHQHVDAVLNCSFASDVSQFIRMAKQRGFAKDKIIVSLETGIPESMKALGAELPEGWIMTGYPPEQIDTPTHKAFVAKYKKRWGEMPGWMSLNGYDAYQFIFAALKKAPTLKPDDLVKAMEGIDIVTPIGPLHMRAADHVSTQGMWVGLSHVENGQPMLKDWTYYPGEQFLIDESKIKPTR